MPFIIPEPNHSINLTVKSLCVISRKKAQQIGLLSEFKGLKILFCTILFFSSFIVGAQEIHVIPGEIAKELVSISNGNQKYAVYLPSNYNTKKVWPILCVMDPRGRAVLGLNLFKESAEELGYILVSSYNTLSDTPNHPNDEALEAMINDSFAMFSVDKKRVFLSGFSGTALFAWDASYALGDMVAGVIGFGMGMTMMDYIFNSKIAKTRPIPFFGGSGYYDFNYYDVRSTEKTMRELGYPYRFIYYKTIHSWPAEKLCSRALYWMHLNSMKVGRLESDQRFIDQLFNDEQNRADSLLIAGETYEAYELLNAIYLDFNSLKNISGIKEKLNGLEATESIIKTKKLIGRQIEDYRKESIRYSLYLNGLRAKRNIPDLKVVSKKLMVESHLKNLDTKINFYDSIYDRVVLEHIFVLTSFYDTNFYIGQKAYTHAQRMLEVAEMIKPGNVRNCIQMARLYTRKGEMDEAVETLGCMSGYAALESFVKSDTVLHVLQEHPSFELLIESIEKN